MTAQSDQMPPLPKITDEMIEAESMLRWFTYDHLPERLKWIRTHLRCIELDGVLYCVAHDGIIDELSQRVSRDGDPACDQWDEYDDVCRMVPLYIRVTEDGRG